MRQNTDDNIFGTNNINNYESEPNINRKRKLEEVDPNKNISNKKRI